MIWDILWEFVNNQLLVEEIIKLLEMMYWAQLVFRNRNYPFGINNEVFLEVCIASTSWSPSWKCHVHHAHTFSVGNIRTKASSSDNVWIRSCLVWKSARQIVWHLISITSFIFLNCSGSNGKVSMASCALVRLTLKLVRPNVWLPSNMISKTHFWTYAK